MQISTALQRLPLSTVPIAGSSIVYNRYDGTPESLAPKSRRPHHHPNEYSDQEISLIHRMRKRRPNTGLVRFRVHLRKKGYTRSITGLYRCIQGAIHLLVHVLSPATYPPFPVQDTQSSNG